MSVFQHTKLGWVMFGLLLVIGTLLRLDSALSKPFWVDEAESSINAETILLHGLPTDTFLDQPIYENILIRPWLGSEEYEFDDLSYSAKGVAVYHGWLPLYTIAGSMVAFGQTPDQRVASRKPVHGPESLVRRTFVPRLPAVLFALVFMVMMYGLGRTLGGPAAGWAVLVYAALAKKNIFYGSQARYYSLTLVLIAGCGWSLWHIIRHGRWRDYLLGSFCWVLLFHTHTASCLGMSIVALVTLPRQRKSPRVWLKRITAFSLVALGTLPWVWWTGYLSNAGGIPPAWRMDGFTSAVLAYVLQRPTELGLFCIGLVAAMLAWWFADRMPRRLVEAFGARRGALALVSVWAGVMFLAFVLGMPAASFFMTRLSLMIAVPCILLASMIVAGLSYLVSHRYAHLIAPVGVLALMAVTGRLPDFSAILHRGDPYNTVRSIMAYLDRADLPEDTRLYATPNTHLTLTYYTGLPIQSVAPVRKSYLDRYPGRVVIFEKHYFTPPPSVGVVLDAAGRAGVELTDGEVRDWASRIHSRLQREEIAPNVTAVVPGLRDIPDYLDPLVKAQRASNEMERNTLAQRLSNSLMFYGFTIRTSRDWWQTYKYRFVDPASRSGPNVNYTDRARAATVTAIPDGRCMVYDCPALINVPSEPSSVPTTHMP